jgi:glycosyltransferase involved in cell wall biosynthesis
VWNGERYLAEAIASILTQTFEALELVILDDGSTDRSAAIAEEFACEDARVKLIRLPHGGLTQALNVGIEHAKARYIVRMDADDISFPTRLAKQIAYLDAHPQCVVIGSDIEVIDADGEIVGHAGFPTTHAGILQLLLGGAGLRLIHPATVMRRDTLLAVGGYRAESFPSDDLDLWIRLADIGEFGNIPEPLLRYRRHENTICSREHERQAISSLAALNAARLKRGLKPLRPKLNTTGHSAEAVYHAECARFALRAGLRWRCARHARASITSAPLWHQPYALLTACALPTRVIAPLLRVSLWLRTIRL